MMEYKVLKQPITRSNNAIIVALDKQSKKPNGGLWNNVIYRLSIK